MGRRPLYDVASRGNPRGQGQYNAGLWYDKFCDEWRHDIWSMKASDRHNPKLQWISAIAGRVGSTTLLDERKLRSARFVRARSGIFKVLVNRTRLVYGLGLSHPVENGFGWHHSLGVPFLPGSSVKGAAKAWARLTRKPDEVKAIFGEEETGGVDFLDALPLEPVTLEPDVLTPHYAQWDPSDPPGDWKDPNPVYFLVVAPFTPFLFGVVPRKSGSLADQALECAIEALEYAGAGAKTDVGYGSFERAEDLTEQLLSTLKALERDRRREARRLELRDEPWGEYALEIQDCSEISRERGTPDGTRASPVRTSGSPLALGMGPGMART